VNRRFQPLLVLISFVLLALPQSLVSAQNIVTINGTVKDHDSGNPIPHASVLVYKYSKSAWQKVSQLEADQSGFFALNLSTKDSFRICVYYDDPSTPGFDYVPSVKDIQTFTPGKMNMTFGLWSGASLLLDGEALFVETTEAAQSSYSVLNTSSGAVMQPGNYRLYYAKGEVNLNYFLGLDQKHLIVPANTSFMVKVDSKIMVEGKSQTRSFLVDQPNHFVLGKGEAVHADLRAFSLPMSMSTVRTGSDEVSKMVEDMESKGFYLAVERQSLSKITYLILDAEGDLNQCSYGTCFTSLREAYLEISNVRNWIAGASVEASRSIFLLLPFLAFTATATSFLLFEEKTRKVVGSLAFYAAFLSALYLLYPGSSLVNSSLFLGASLLSIVSILGITTISPRVLEDRVRRRDVPLQNMVAPMFSIAKRSLRRRRIRSVLTFVSVMVFVSSFIALTSFSSGFGLTFSQVSGSPGPSTGALIRAPKPSVIIKPELYTFSPLDNTSVGYFATQPETSFVAPKYENLPRPTPLDYLGGAPIFGVIGIVPSIEAKILPWNETIVEGGFLSDSDDNGVLISASLKERLNTMVGANLTLNNWKLRLKVVGVFDDKKLEGIKDLDGQSLLSQKMIVIAVIEHPDGSRELIFGLTSCSTDETVVVTWKTALKLESSGVYISRLDIVLNEGMNLKEYVREIALNKGFRAWASTGDGIYLAELGSYFEGKGLPVIVPWGIVVLSVVVTMLNSLYERRKEIFIYSAIGMSPSHITGLFLAEVTVIGVIGGGIGYLLGLGWYKAISSLSLAIQVKQKVSALWVLAAIAVSLAAVLVGGLVAIKGSVVITPSLMRRWRVEKGAVKAMGLQELTLPIKVSGAEAEEFIKYMVKGLESHRDDIDFVTDWIRERTEEEKETKRLPTPRELEKRFRASIDDLESATRRIGEGVGKVERARIIEDVASKLRVRVDELESVARQIREESLERQKTEQAKKGEKTPIGTIEFVYREAGGLKKRFSKNKVLLMREGDTYTVKLSSEGNIEIHRIGSLVRRIAMEWSIERGKLEETA